MRIWHPATKKAEKARRRNVVIVKWVVLASAGLLVLIFIGAGIFAPDPPKLSERVTASCQKEYASTPGLIDQCVISTMQRHVGEAYEAKAQRAYNRSR
jgi:hypothetical protein